MESAGFDKLFVFSKWENQQSPLAVYLQQFNNQTHGAITSTTHYLSRPTGFAVDTPKSIGINNGVIFLVVMSCK